jgi:hypothetical protein
MPIKRVTTRAIDDQQITADKLANNSVTTGKILDGAVTLAKVAANAVDSTKIADNAVTELKISSGAVSSDKLANSSTTQAKLAANVVGTGPAFRAHNSTATSIPTNSATKVTLGTKSFDTNNNFDTTLSRFTPTVAGYYQINCSVYIFFAPFGLRVEIRKNGDTVTTGSEPNERNVASNASDIIYCNGSSDYIEMFAYHTGTAASTQNDPTRTFMSGCLIRSA